MSDSRDFHRSAFGPATSWSSGFREGVGSGRRQDRMEADVGADVRAGYLTARAASRDYGLPIAELPS